MILPILLYPHQHLILSIFSLWPSYYTWNSISLWFDLHFLKANDAEDLFMYLLGIFIFFVQMSNQGSIPLNFCDSLRSSSLHEALIPSSSESYSQRHHFTPAPSCLDLTAAANTAFLEKLELCPSWLVFPITLKAPFFPNHWEGTNRNPSCKIQRTEDSSILTPIPGDA